MLFLWKEENRNKFSKKMIKVFGSPETFFQKGFWRGQGAAPLAFPLLLLLLQLHRQRDALLLQIDRDDADLHNVADRNYLGGMLDKAIGQLGDMHKAVLMHADIHKRTKVDDVADGALEDHVGLEVLHLHDVGAQLGRRQRVAQVASGLLQLGDDIHQRRLTHGKLLADLGDAVSLDLGGTFLPARLFDAWNLSFICKFAEADSANSILFEHRMWTSADGATSIFTS